METTSLSLSEAEMKLLPEGRQSVVAASHSWTGGVGRGSQGFTTELLPRRQLLLSLFVWKSDVVTSQMMRTEINK